MVSAEIARIHCYGKGNAFRLMETHWSSVSAFAQYIWSGFFCYSSLFPYRNRLTFLRELEALPPIDTGHIKQTLDVVPITI